MSKEDIKRKGKNLLLIYVVLMIWQLANKGFTVAIVIGSLLEIFGYGVAIIMLYHAVKIAVKLIKN